MDWQKSDSQDTAIHHLTRRTTWIDNRPIHKTPLNLTSNTSDDMDWQQTDSQDTAKSNI